MIEVLQRFGSGDISAVDSVTMKHESWLAKTCGKSYMIFAGIYYANLKSISSGDFTMVVMKLPKSILDIRTRS